MRLIKKVFFLGLALLFTMALFYRVSSYSQASVSNLAAIKIVDPEDALIAIPSFNKRNNRRTAMEAVGNNGQYYIAITNNMAEQIKVEARFDYGKDIDIDIPDDGRVIFLDPGETGRIPFNVTAAKREPVLEPAEINETVDVTIFADWNGGSAEIEGCVDVALKVNPELTESIPPGNQMLLQTQESPKNLPKLNSPGVPAGNSVQDRADQEQQANTPSNREHLEQPAISAGEMPASEDGHGVITDAPVTVPGENSKEMTAEEKKKEKAAETVVTVPDGTDRDGVAETNKNSQDNDVNTESEQNQKKN